MHAKSAEVAFWLSLHAEACFNAPGLLSECYGNGFVWWVCWRLRLVAACPIVSTAHESWLVEWSMLYGAKCSVIGCLHHSASATALQMEEMTILIPSAL